jgi:crotonobetainyl-CoA hydratase
MPDRSDAVPIRQVGRVLVATINRPDVLNAVNRDVAAALALDRAENDDEIWAFIVTGTGDRAFCAGADLKAFSRGEPPELDDPQMRAWGFAGYVRHPISKPTIAAVNGLALGGGTEIVLASDLAVAAEAASFGAGSEARSSRQRTVRVQPLHPVPAVVAPRSRGGCTPSAARGATAAPRQPGYPQD